MTSQGRLLDFPQHHEILQNFYNSDEVLRSRQRRLKFMTRYFSSVLERMLTAAGANSFKRADEYAKENKAFVFAFEINAYASSNTSSGRRRGKDRPSINLRLKSYLIKKVIWYKLVTLSWPPSCWD